MGSKQTDIEAEMIKDDMIMHLEELRKEMKFRIDELINCEILKVKEGTSYLQTGIGTIKLKKDINVLKGKKPVGVDFTERCVSVKTWKSVAIEILKYADQDKDCHEKLLKLRNRFFGKTREILSDKAENMKCPLKISNDIYFEGKFDTEYLLLMIKKILDIIEFEYDNIEIQYIVDKELFAGQ